MEVDATDHKRTQATGLAVQKQGMLLAVAHGPLNEFRLLDKKTGRRLKVITVPDPKGVAFAPDGDLWIITNTSVVRYTGLPEHPAQAAIIEGRRNTVTDSIFDLAQHPGVAGNAYAASLFTADNELYQTNNDEASHGGVHRWHLRGANDLRLLQGTGAVGDDIRVAAAKEH